MRKGIGVAIYFILTIFSAAAAPLKVVSWNLEWFPGGSPEARPADKKKHMKAAQEALKTLNPDVLCLQEVKDWKAVQELVSVVPNLRVAVVSRFPGDQQQAIASKLSSDSAWADVWDSRKVSDIPRGYSFAALKDPSGGFLLVYSLHMKANRGGDDGANISRREESGRQLLAHAVAMQEVYGARGKVGIVIAGDFNTTLDKDPRFESETTIRNILASGFKTAWEGIPYEQRITHPGSNGFASITFDHVLAWGLGFAFAGVVQFPDVSDHMPVVVTITSLPAAAGITPVPIATIEPGEALKPPQDEKKQEGVTMEVEGGAGFRVREISITPPTFNPGVPGIHRPPSPAPANP